MHWPFHPRSPLLHTAPDAERKQCIVCRAPVDETRVLDASQLPPEAVGRQFVPPAPSEPQGSGDKKSSGSGSGSGAPQIELRAFAGSSAAAGAAAAAGQPPAVPAAATPTAEYLPGYLSPSPRAASQAGPAPFVGVLVEGASQSPLASQPPQPLRTITVVRPRTWARRLVLFGMFLTLLAVIIAVAVVMSHRAAG